MRSGSSQDYDGGTARHRQRRPLTSNIGPAPEIMVPVKRVGRHVKRDYCERCGQKRRACRCEK